jgi:hypothetical protein
MSSDFDFGADEPRRRPERRRPAARFPFLTVIAVVGGTMLGLALLSLLVDQAARPPAGVQPQHDPYDPDCAIVRRWLRQQYGDVEIVSWGRRTIFRSEYLGGSVHLSCRFRVKGGAVRSGSFTIDASNMVVSSRIDD